VKFSCFIQKNHFTPSNKGKNSYFSKSGLKLGCFCLQNQKMMEEKNLPMARPLNTWLPFLFALILSAGMLIGFRLQKIYGGSTINAQIGGARSAASYGTLEEVLRYIDAKYVNSIDRGKMEEEAISSLLQNLDPHSAYIPARDLQAVNDDLEGEFDGVGIEFMLLNDTIAVVNAISGGPSEKVGIRSGDKIIRVDDSLVAGVKIQNKGIVRKLRGKKGSSVKVGIKRVGIPNLLNFNVVRDKIPLYSVDAAYMAAPKVGYIKINKFASTTYKEFVDAVDDMVRNKAMQHLVIDLRGNGGGYLNAATKILDIFFQEQELLVYTKARDDDRMDYKASGRPLYNLGNIAVLVDEGSASASEIMAGALQDHDRATIIGRRTFGKGLVQEQYELSDGSGLRLTVAKYYTPSGRCIQKPYSGNSHYEDDITQRFKHGEMANQDSIKQTDTTKFYTDKGRLVYAGGGIMPDIFVPLDTTGQNAYFAAVAGFIPEFSYNFYEKNQLDIQANYKTVEQFSANYTITPATLKEFALYAERNGEKQNPALFKQTESLISERIKAYIARRMFKESGFFYVINAKDKAYLKAIQTIQK
jgi:carboxyl-terminal processing protease